MDIPTNPGSAEARSHQAPIRVSEDGIHVMKVASPFGEGAVAVDLTIRSDRANRCDIQVTDVLPEAVRDNNVEFHPKYDPDHWSREMDQVIYRAPLGPGVVRRTVYGVAVDDLEQLSSFSVEPTVEVIDGADVAGNERSGDSSVAAAESEFSYGQSGDAMVDDAKGPDPGSDSIVAALVSEVQRRGLTPQEQATIRTALGLDADREALQSLADAIAAIEGELKTLQERESPADTPAMDLDGVEARLEAISSELQSVADSLSADLDELRGALESEIRWRSQFRQSLAIEPNVE